MTLAFITLNLIFLGNGYYYLSAIPFILLILWLALTSLDKFLLLIVFFVPVSIPLSRIIGKSSIDLYLPTEPMLAGVLLLIILKIIQGQIIDKSILRHPVTIAILLNITWIFITSITSSMPVVSFKFLIARIWFVISFYLLAAQLFRNGLSMKSYLLAYLIPMMFVIFFVIIKLSGYGLTNQHASNFVVDPFFSDHTSYGAILAMLIPPVFAIVILSLKGRFLTRLFLFLMLAVYLTAFIFSYTRAAWLSLAVAFGFWILIILKIKWYYIIIGAIIFSSIIMNQRNEIFIKIRQNTQTSSGKFMEHVQSIGNIRTDASNLERVNRWYCAIRMFLDRPVFGWGPGTYMFQYAPFQRTAQKTIISTNAGTLGNAHSEYLGPLSEQGAIGIISIISIISLTIWSALRIILQTARRKQRIFILSVFLGLMTYYFHGILNNFLDTDKASALFWGFTAMIVAADLDEKDFRESGSSGKIPDPDTGD